MFFEHRFFLAFISIFKNDCIKMVFRLIPECLAPEVRSTLTLSLYLLFGQ